MDSHLHDGAAWDCLSCLHPSSSERPLRSSALSLVAIKEWESILPIAMKKMASTWALAQLLIKSQTAFSTDLAAMALRIPHHQVREAPSAVPKVSSQTPAHTTEDWTPEAGDKILNTKQRRVTHLQEETPKWA